jgi:alpha-amylase
LATVLSNSEEGFKDMYVGEQYAGQTFADYTGNREDKVEIGEDGNGRFPVNAGSISVWVKDAISPEEAFDANAVE